MKTHRNVQVYRAKYNMHQAIIEARDKKKKVLDEKRENKKSKEYL